MRNNFSLTDYSPFGAPIYTYDASGAGEYRYGFNGKELDSEGMGGGGNTYDYGFRIYNPSIAKFLSVDPLSKDYPWYTPYQFAGNKPIWASDLDGLEEFIRTDYFNSTGNLYRSVIQVVEENFVENGVRVHLCSVFVNESGNATSRYEGSYFTFGGDNSQSNISQTFGSLSALIHSETTLIRNTRDKRVSQTGSLVRTILPSSDAITESLSFLYNPDDSRILMGIQVGESSLVQNPDIQYPDPSNNGIIVFEPNQALVPITEPYLPSGFNVVPPSSQRFNIEGGFPLVNGGQELDYNSSLDLQYYHAVGSSHRNKSAASIDSLSRSISHQPSMREVGIGTPAKGTLEVIINQNQQCEQ